MSNPGIVTREFPASPKKDIPQNSRCSFKMFTICSVKIRLSSASAAREKSHQHNRSERRLANAQPIHGVRAERTRLRAQLLRISPVWARERCRKSPPRFLAECCKRQLNQGIVLFCCILRCLLFLICIEFVYLYFPVRFCLSVPVK